MIISLKTLQINMNKSLSITEHVLQLAIELNILILAIQEPWTIGNNIDGYRSVLHPSFKQVLPNYGSLRPRALFYILNSISTALAPNSPQDPDCIILDLVEYKTQLINVYNATHPESESLSSTKTLQRIGLLPDLLLNNTILLRDFNIHHP